MYRPLSDNLTIENSPINGLGLFAKRHILKHTNLGISHYEICKDIRRTPLGGFYNHSDDPNCVKMKTIDYINDSTYYSLCSLKFIPAGEEITVDYTFYKIKEGK